MRATRRYVLVIGITLLLVLIFILLSRSSKQSTNNEQDTTKRYAEKPKHLENKIPRVWSRKRADQRELQETFHQLRTESSIRRENMVVENFNSERMHLKQVSKFQDDMTQFDFTECRMSNCFDFTRCKSNGPLRVHIIPGSVTKGNDLNLTGESNAIHRTILKIIRNSEYHESDPNKACIFVLEDDIIDRDPLSQSFKHYVTNVFQSKHNYGMNHLIFNLYSGSWPDYRGNDYAGMLTGAAILAKASNSITNHRTNFDISIPLFSYLHGTSNDTATGEQNVRNKTIRKHFLTFKGKRYVVGTGSETRNNLYHLNNEKDVITLTTCRHGKKWLNSNDFRCAVDENSYNNYDFNDLMKQSTYCLTPRGRRLGSFRFLEALGFGCIPVILSDGWVWPFEEIIDWSKAAIQFNENQLLLVPDMLRDIEAERVALMSANCLKLYASYFSTIEKIVKTTLIILEKRIKNELDSI